MLDACVGCGRTLEPDEPARFDVDAGGVCCTRCRPHGRLLDTTTRAQVARMVRGQLPDPGTADWSLHAALLRAFLSAHLSLTHPLRALDLFAQQLRFP